MPLRALWDDGRPTFGVWCILGYSLVVEMLGRAGFDWVGIDAQHGLIGPSETIAAVQAISATETPAFVRVTANDAGEIGKALDAGAEGVIVPMVNCAEEARRAVAACRYAPEGVRSWGPTRTVLHRPGLTPPQMNREVVCVVMIETVEGVDHVEEIARVEGVDAIFIGPTDLAISAGFPPSVGDEFPEHEELIARVLATCRKYDRPAGIYCNGVAMAQRRLEQGFRMLAAVTDMTLLNAAAQTAASSMRQAKVPV